MDENKKETMDAMRTIFFRKWNDCEHFQRLINIFFYKSMGSLINTSICNNFSSVIRNENLKPIIEH